MSKIVMIRHGETQWNAERRSQGWLDPPLNDLGKRQAELLGKHIRRHYEFERVVSSDSKRCTMTADGLQLVYSTDPLLREINTGKFGGMLIDDIQREYPDDVIAWGAGYGKAPDGESWLDLVARAGRFLAESGILDVEGDVCIVSHGGTIRALLSVMLDIDINTTRRFAQSNTGITVVENNPNHQPPTFTLELLNSTEHLND